MDADVKADVEVSEGVDRLHIEIDRAVALIDQLKNANADLTTQKQALEERLQKNERDFAEARADRDRLQGLYDENAALIDNKAVIQGKIDQMISRLDAVHNA
jgi:predicted  nucleic acid-binding Zn-ribbon protein